MCIKVVQFLLHGRADQVIWQLLSSILVFINRLEVVRIILDWMFAAIDKWNRGISLFGPSGVAIIGLILIGPIHCMHISLESGKNIMSGIMNHLHALNAISRHGHTLEDCTQELWRIE